jgi:pyruvate/2-oxoglutarate/acetoin dehydrogenase E1 component
MTSVLESINAGLHRAMDQDPRVYLLGEDILDPYGGAFKVTRGLSTKHPDRVLTTPISEAAITGIANGMALRGLRPVVEIMFGDFVTLIADQIVNHAAKFRWMYNDNVRVPIVVRAPMGGRRGYGPTHSQSLEKLFLGVPGLRVIAPNTLSDAGALIENAILADDDPVLYVEHKLLYLKQQLTATDVQDFKIETFGKTYPAHVIQYKFAERSDITLACYGYNFELARQTANDLLMEHEIFSEIVLFSELSPFHINPLIRSIQRTKRMLAIEEGSLALGWGAELIARLAESGAMDVAMKRIAGLDFPIPNARPLEDIILPTQNLITKTALEMVKE